MEPGVLKIGTFQVQVFKMSLFHFKIGEISMAFVVFFLKFLGSHIWGLILHGFGCWVKGEFSFFVELV